MLKNINKLFTGELLKVLYDMGHGDELAIVDANYPADTMGERVIKLPGIEATKVLDVILEVFPIDHVKQEAAVLLDLEEVDIKNGMETPAIWKEFQTIIDKQADIEVEIGKISRKDFYERSKKASVIIQTGEERLYGDIILVKGVIK